MFTEDQLKDAVFWNQRLEKINEKLKEISWIHPDMKIMLGNEWVTAFDYPKNKKIKDSFVKITDNLNSRGMVDKVSMRNYEADLRRENTPIEYGKPQLIEKGDNKDSGDGYYMVRNFTFILTLDDENRPDPTKTYNIRKKKGALDSIERGTALAFADIYMFYPTVEAMKNTQFLYEYGWEINNLNEENFTIANKTELKNIQDKTGIVKKLKPMAYLRFLATDPDYGALGAILVYAVRSIFLTIPIILELDESSGKPILRKIYNNYGFVDMRTMDEGPLKELLRYMIKHRVAQNPDTDAFDPRLPDVWMIHSNEYDAEHYKKGLYAANP